MNESSSAEVTFSQILKQVSIQKILSTYGGELLVRGRCRCPICGNRNNKSVFVAKEKDGVWACHRCGKSGGKLALLEALGGLSRREASVRLAELAGVTLRTGEQKSDLAQRMAQEREIREWIIFLLDLLSDISVAYRYAARNAEIRADRMDEEASADSAYKWAYGLETDAHVLDTFIDRITVTNKWERMYRGLPNESEEEIGKHLLALYKLRHKIGKYGLGSLNVPGLELPDMDRAESLLQQRREDNLLHLRRVWNEAKPAMMLLCAEATPSEWTSALQETIRRAA